MYFRARYYSGELGRFASLDPLGTALDVNWMNDLRFFQAGLNYHDGMQLAKELNLNAYIISLISSASA